MKGDCDKGYARGFGESDTGNGGDGGGGGGVGGGGGGGDSLLFLAQQLPVGQGLLIHEVSRSQDSSRRVISSSQRPLPDNTQYSEHPYPRWDSNPQSQQASGRRPTP